MSAWTAPKGRKPRFRKAAPAAASLPDKVAEASPASLSSKAADVFVVKTIEDTPATTKEPPSTAEKTPTAAEQSPTATDGVKTAEEPVVKRTSTLKAIAPCIVFFRAAEKLRETLALLQVEEALQKFAQEARRLQMDEPKLDTNHVISLFVRANSQPIGKGSIWCRDRRFYNLLLGKNPDGSERVTFKVEPITDAWGSSSSKEEPSDDSPKVSSPFAAFMMPKGKSWGDEAAELESITKRIVLPPLVSPLTLKLTPAQKKTGDPPQLQLEEGKVPLFDPKQFVARTLFCMGVPDNFDFHIILDAFSLHDYPQVDHIRAGMAKLTFKYQGTADLVSLMMRQAKLPSGKYMAMSYMRRQQQR